MSASAKAVKQTGVGFVFGHRWDKLGTLCCYPEGCPVCGQYGIKQCSPRSGAKRLRALAAKAAKKRAERRNAEWAFIKQRYLREYRSDSAAQPELFR